MTRRRALALMIVTLLVAALLRLPDLPQVPPGLHYDEAANALLATEIGTGAETPLFISSYTGKEVLFFYLAGGLMRLVGSSVFGLRLTSAFLGMLTVAATYWLGRELLADRRVAVLAAALLAISFWHLLFSRLGFRAISQPLLQALAIAALFRGLKQNEQRWLIVAGIFLGLTAYTYLAARLFPLLLAVALVPFLFSGVRRRLSQLALFGGVAFLVLLPLLIYFYQYPDAFWVRISQVAPGEANPGLLESYARSLGIYFLVGDPYWRFNLPGRPLFNWLWGGLLLVGWGVSLRRWRHWWYDWQKAAVLLLLFTPFIMVLPTALAVAEIVPSNLRAIGLIPFIFYLPALGLITLLEQAADLVRRPGERATEFLRWLNLLEGYDINYAFVVLATLLLGGVFTAQSYFQRWAIREDLIYDSDADLVAVAAYLNGLTDRDETLYLSAPHYRHPTVAFLSERYDAVKWLLQSQALVFPAEGTVRYIFPHSSPLAPWAIPYLTQATVEEGPPGPDGGPLFVAYTLDELPRLTPSQELDVNFDNRVQLLGYEVGETGAGGTLPLTLFWRVSGSPLPALRLFVHLLDPWGNRWSQVEPTAYPSEQWEEGEIVIQRVEVPVPPGTPPGSYRLRVGFFDAGTGARLPRLDAGGYAGDSLFVEGVPVGAGNPLPDPSEAPWGVPQEVRSGLTLLGYERGNEPVAAGAALPLALWWWATEPQPSLTVRLELMRNDNTGIILLNTAPVHGTYPFDNWTTPQFVIDEINPQFPSDLEGGDYRLHLRILDENGDTVFTTSLGAVTVVATDRVYDVPAPEFPLAATLGGEIKLHGYNLEQVAEHEFALSLVWQAKTVPATDYTVFVHVLYEDGSCCLWQQDLMPRQGSYPTSRWLPGEVVVDEYRISLPPDVTPGTYSLEVGLYVAENGRRLSVAVPGEEIGDAVLLQPLSVGQ